jgi:hypothetical protein
MSIWAAPQAPTSTSASTQHINGTNTEKVYENNRRLLEGYKDRLGLGLTGSYLETLEKVIKWVSNERAFYNEAQTHVSGLLPES